MPLDPGAKRFLERLAKLGPPSARALTIGERRRALEHLLSFAGPQGGGQCEVEERSFPGPGGALRARLYVPGDLDGAAPPGMLFFHGGGLVAGSLDSHDGICRQLSRASGSRLISVDYRLGPEHRFPAAIEDGLAAARWASENAADLGIDPYRLIIAGDSAGATLAAVICQQLAGDERVPVALQFLLCPILDFRAQTESRRELAEGYFLDQATLDHDLEHYLEPETDPLDPRVSPLRAADVSLAPPTCIHTAEFDPLRDEGRSYAERLKSVGVSTLYRCHSGMIHLFYGMGTMIPYASTGFELMGADIRSMLATRDEGGR